MYKVVLWGLGGGYDMFVASKGYEMVDVIAVADRNNRFLKNVDGIPIVHPKELSEIEFDYLIVSVLEEYIYKEIICEAIKIGIRREKILPGRIFQIPFFSFDEYIEIKNSNVSILSDYCFAGYLYHRFGLQFTSPTINMYAENDMYYKFLSDIKGHLQEPMVEVKNTLDDTYRGIYTFPRGRVGDSEWIFNHDICFETAEARWKKGVSRFNYDNFIAIMTIRSKEMAYMFDELPIKNKIGFFWEDLNLDSIIYMPEWKDPYIRAKSAYDFAVLVNRVADGKQGVRKIDWMKMLLHKEGYCRNE